MRKDASAWVACTSDTEERSSRDLLCALCRCCSRCFGLPTFASSSLFSYFSALEVKFLRVSISSFLEMLAMATDTLAQFTLGAPGAAADNGAAS